MRPKRAFGYELLLGAGVFALALVLAGPRSQAEPILPCNSQGSVPYPAYGALGDPPTVSTWRDIELKYGSDCVGSMRGPMKLVVALAGRFAHSGSVEDIASRIGAISSTEGVLYWSTTQGDWQVLISEAFALQDSESDTPRPDFTAAEILSGRKVYYAQNDRGSTGLNVYALIVRRIGPDSLAATTTNLAPIRFLHVTLFEARSLVSVRFVQRLKPGVWGYYGLLAAKDGRVEGHEKSFINRAAAQYRFLVGQDAAKDPPLAP